MTFNPGDLVRLKSGGPTMTVSLLHNDGSARCIWYSRQYGSYQNEDLGCDLLTAVTVNDQARYAMAEIASGLPPCQGNCTDHDGGCGKPDCVWNKT